MRQFPHTADRTPTRDTTDERRLQLLQAAQAVFVACGYHGASMERIAHKAHVSKPVLYRYFPSKRELYSELLDINLRTLTDVLQEPLHSPKGSQERVHDVIRAYFHFIARDDGAYQLAFETGLTNDPDISVRLEAFSKGIVGTIARTISEDAQLPFMDAELLGRALMGLTQASARYWIEANAEQSSPTTSLDTASELIYRLAWRGISGFPKEP